VRPHGSKGTTSMQLSAGDTAWVLASTALVLLMAPGLAIFYGGMTRAKSTLNMMMMTFASIGIVSIVWVVYGWSLGFGDSGSAFYGAFSLTGIREAIGSLTNNGGVYGIPLLAFAGFQLMFAIVTVALVSGAIADRAKFGTWCVFVLVWVTLVYLPVAHWVFDLGTKQPDGTITGAGWLASLGLEDFAGGTVVEICSGAAGLALALVLGRRHGFGRHPYRPHNLPLVLLGAGLLWFGWLGFNAGSALGANDLAAIVLLNTQVAGAAGMGGWLLVEKVRDGRPTSLGAASGAVAGLVAITPSGGFVEPWAAALVGLVAGIVCSYAVSVKHRLGYDDSLDVAGVHMVGGIVGTLAIGLLGAHLVNAAGVDGLLYGGGLGLLGKQTIGVVSVLAYSFVVTLIIGLVLDRTMGFRISRDAELEGIDLVEHAESAYELEGSVHSGGGFSGGGSVGGLGSGIFRDIKGSGSGREEDGS